MNDKIEKTIIGIATIFVLVFFGVIGWGISIGVGSIVSNIGVEATLINTLLGLLGMVGTAVVLIGLYYLGDFVKNNLLSKKKK